MTLPRRTIHPLDPPDGRFEHVLADAHQRRRHRALSVLGVTAVFLAGLGGGMSLDSGVSGVPDGLVRFAGQFQPGDDQPATTTSTEASRTPTGTSSPARRKAKTKDDSRPRTMAAPAAPSTATAPQGVLAVNGIAVDPEGTPVAGMYVYAGDPDADTFVPLPDPAGVTGRDGTFALACPNSPVLLTPWPLNQPAGSLVTSADWAATFVGGATDPRNASQAPCDRDEEPSVVRLQPGSAVEGTAEIAAACDDGRTLRVALFGDPRTTVRLTDVNDGQSFRIGGLPPGEHVLTTADLDRTVDVDVGTTSELDLSWPCDTPTPTPTPTTTPTPTQTSTPTATSEPTPSTSQPPPIPSPSTSTTSPSGGAG